MLVTKQFRIHDDNNDFVNANLHDSIESLAGYAIKIWSNSSLKKPFSLENEF